MKISVIIPVYNTDKYIVQTLNCLTKQTMKDLEIIVLQDGCTDNTVSLVQSYITNHPDCAIKSIIFETNKGSSHIRNTGAAVASGDYIHFMDADDIIDVDFYQKLYDAAVQSDADIACCGIINEFRPAQSLIHDQCIVVTNAQDKIDYTNSDRYGYSPRYLIKRSFWKDAEFAFPENLKYCEDVALIPRIILEANHVVLVPDTFYIYKHRQNSLLTSATNANRIARKNDHRAATLIRDQLYCKYNLHPSCPRIDVLKQKLFGVIPVIRTEYNHERVSTKTYFFGILISSKSGE